MENYIIDTNALLDNPQILEKRRGVKILSIVLKELETLERKKDQKTLQYQIRQAKQAIKRATKSGKAKIVTSDSEGIQGFDSDYADNIILNTALKNGWGIITNDLLMIFKAEYLGISILEQKVEETTYLGYKEVSMTKEDMNSIIFQHLDKNVFDLAVNEYLVVKEFETVIGLFKWVGEWLEVVADSKGRMLKTLNTSALGNLKAKDAYQSMAMDSIETNQVTMLRGKPGTGKTFLAVNEAWSLVEKQGYKMVVFFNPVPSLNSVELGFYPGSLVEKFMCSSAGVMLKAKFGGDEGLLDKIAHKDIEVLPFVDLRGYDTSGERPVVVLILEAQNLTIELLKMGLQRVDEHSKVIIDGDYEQQIDRAVYANDNGMKRASEVLRGIDLYGEVKLSKVYRSRLADLVDDM